MLRRLPALLTGCCLLVLTTDITPRTIEGELSYLELDRHRLRFAPDGESFASVALDQMAATVDSVDDFAGASASRKSPLKAFLLSAALPGAGQFYCGSRVKPLCFLAAEITAWGLHFKWQGDGDRATDDYERFNRDHWLRDNYEQKYLYWAFGVTDDDSLFGHEVTHHLPDTETQQYFEMTGKYNQFAWGWDDAVRNDSTLDDFANNPSVRITGEETTPNSANRLIYEGMRHDANRKYDRARKMVIVSIINRLVSGFEAYFSAKHRNEKAAGGTPGFAGIRVRALLKSYNTSRDTPFVRLSYKF